MGELPRTTDARLADEGILISIHSSTIIIHGGKHTNRWVFLLFKKIEV